MNDEIVLSVVIATWNTKKQTEECIQSIISLPEYSDNTEIILIDNASNDGTAESVKEKFPQVKLIINDENTGYAPACNKGISVSRGKYILLLGSDTILKPGSLKKTVEYLNKKPDAGAVGCKLMYPDGTLQGNCKRFPKLFNAFLTYTSLNRFNYDYDMRGFDYNETIQVEQIATTFLMVRGDLMKKLKGFDESYRIMYNDVDLCKRIYEEGKKIMFLHDAEVYHHGSLSTNKADYKLRKVMYEDIYRYYKKNHGAKASFLLPVLKIRLLSIKLFKS
ncbi:MAG: glycosyltransferase family 2 protein [Candidatus Kapaibacterium sp.]